MALYAATCNGCATSAVIRCNCTGTGHDDNCAAADFDAAVTCREDAECCAEDHHHGQAASESGTPCRPITITVLELGAPLQKVAS